MFPLSTHGLKFFRNLRFGNSVFQDSADFIPPPFFATLAVS